MLEGLIRSEEKLLPGLAPGIKGPRHLYTAKRTICQQTAVFPREGDSLCHALVDYIETDLSQAMNVRFPRSKVPSFNRVVEQTEYAIAVVLIILGGVDTALRRDTMCPPRRVLEAKAFDVISEFTQGGSRGGPGQAASHDDDIKFWPVIR